MKKFLALYMADASGMVSCFASRECSITASTRVRDLVLGFRDTRWRMPPGS